MYVIFPRKNEWLPSVVKEMDVISIDHKMVKVWGDTSILDILDFPEDTPLMIRKYDQTIDFEEIMSSEEIEQLKKLNYIFIESIKHVFALDMERFFGDPGEGEYGLDEDAYYVKCKLSDHCKEAFLKKQIIPHLKEVRLKDLFE